MACETYMLQHFGAVDVIHEDGVPILIRQPYCSRGEDFDAALDSLELRHPGFGMTTREIPGAVMWTILLDAFAGAGVTV